MPKPTKNPPLPRPARKTCVRWRSPASSPGLWQAADGRCCGVCRRNAFKGLLATHFPGAVWEPAALAPTPESTDDKFRGLVDC